MMKYSGLALLVIGMLLFSVGCTTSDIAARALPPVVSGVEPETGTLTGADITRFQQYCLDTPDWQGPLSIRLKVRAQAGTWDQLVAQVKPTLTFGQFEGKPLPDCGFPDMLWIETSPTGQPVFRLARAFTWAPTSQAARWVLVDVLDSDTNSDQPLLRQLTQGRPMPARVEVVKKKPAVDHPISYALEKGSDPRGGTVYETGWAVEMLDGTGHYEPLRLLYVWRDPAGRWKFVGEGPMECQGSAGALECIASTCAGTVRWKGHPPAPVISFVEQHCRSEVGEVSVGLPDQTICRDAILEADSAAMPALIHWSNEDYITAEPGDTLEKIVYRLICRDDTNWNAYEANPNAQLLQKRAELRQSTQHELLQLNPQLSQFGPGPLPEGIRVIVSVHASNTQAATTQPAR